MRGGVTIGDSDGTNYVSGCTVLGGQGNFRGGDYSTVEHCQGDATYSSLISNQYQNERAYTMSVTALAENDVIGVLQLINAKELMTILWGLIFNSFRGSRYASIFGLGKINTDIW